jgi:putative peptidoglycan binding protein
MPIHVVKRGEWLSTIAQHYGFADWKIIYNHPDNAAFRKLRPNPNVIEPGDQIVIPDPRAGTKSVTTGTSGQFRIKIQKSVLRLVLCQADGKPLADAEYKLTLGDESITGRTASDGRLEHTMPRGTVEAKLMLPDFGRHFTLKIGELDPLDTNGDGTVAAAQARLRNLGYECGPIDGIAGRRTRAAVRAFQADVLARKHPNGLLDRETRNKLVSEHGC